MTDVNEVLAERQTTHGNYEDHAYMAQLLKAAVRGGVKYHMLTDMERESLDMILHKIGRVLSGNPHFKDHWVDIAGYATLIAKVCE